jgi:hypothetical protein
MEKGGIRSQVVFNRTVQLFATSFIFKLAAIQFDKASSQDFY